MLICSCCDERQGAPGDSDEPCTCTELYCSGCIRCSAHCCCIVSAGLVRAGDEMDGQ